MQITSIASSSTGNCYLISDGSSTLLVECGIQLKKVQEHLHDLSKIDGCLITHEHNDHAGFAKEIIKYTYVYTSVGTWKAINEKNDILQTYKQKVVKHNKPFDVGTFTIIPFDVQHDANEPLGYLIYSNRTKEKLLFATDTYYIQSRFKGVNYIMVECNYDKNLVPEALTKTEYNRLLQSHFELSNVKAFLRATDLRVCKQIYLLHLSSRHSDSKRFKREIEELTGVPTIVCGKG